MTFEQAFAEFRRVCPNGVDWSEWRQPELPLFWAVAIGWEIAVLAIWVIGAAWRHLEDFR